MHRAICVLFRLLICISIGGTLIDGVGAFDQNEMCGEKTCMVILERLGRLEEAFRRAITAIAEDRQLANKLNVLLENDSLVKSVMSVKVSENSANSIYTNITSNQQSTVMNVNDSLEDNSSNINGKTATRVKRRSESNIKKGNSAILKSMTTRPTTVNSEAKNMSSKESADFLRESIKCAIPELLDIVTDSHDFEKLPNATLQADDSLLVEWEWSSNKCFKYMNAFWVRVFDSELYKSESGHGDDAEPRELRLLNEPYTLLPKSCINKSSNSNILSLALSSSFEVGNRCSFPLKKLMECKIYTIEVVPSYSSLKGKSWKTNVIIPPLLTGNSTLAENVHLHNSSSGWHLNWSMNSKDCARRLSILDLRIFEDDIDQTVVSALVIPRKCINASSTDDSYSALLARDRKHGCHLPSTLDDCRRYNFQMEGEFSSKWKGKRTSKMVFTTGLASPTCCNMLTSASGTFSLENVQEELYQNNKCNWLISVKQNHVISLALNNKTNGKCWKIEVFDGRRATGNRKLSGNAIRSSTNNLFVEITPTNSDHSCSNQYRISNFQHYRVHERNIYNTYWLFSASYISIEKREIHNVHEDCGGYITEEGIMADQRMKSTEKKFSICNWFIESAWPNKTILLVNKGNIPGSSYSMTIYDGWSTMGKVFYNQTNPNRAMLYLPGRKVLVQFHFDDSSGLTEVDLYSWTVNTVSQCHFTMQQNSGTIHSPNYPSPYLDNVDCRWEIHVNEAAKIKIIFGYFNTEANMDSVLVYDGLTADSPILLEKSGAPNTPLTVISTSNKMLVRFISNKSVAKQGFLAIYSSIDS